MEQTGRNFEFLVIGGGAIGLSIARELYKKGARNIAVVERGRVGQESSWAAAGMLSPNVDAVVGSVFHRFCRESLELYPQIAEALLSETGINVELDRAGSISVAFDDEGSQKLRQYGRALRDAGYEAEELTADEIFGSETPLLSPGLRSGIGFPNDWQVENRKLLAALKRFAEINGIGIYENTQITELIVKNNSVGGAVAEHTEFLAAETVLATGAWSSHIKFGGQSTPFCIKPVRGQMIWYDCGERPLEKVIYGPRCYLVPRADGRILAGSTTEDVGFENGVTDSAVEQLREAACEMLPLLGEREVAGSWSGLRPRSDDELPVIGGCGGYQNLTVATGHYRNGILLAPLTAKLVADKLIDSKDSEYFDHFSPDRFANDHKIAGA